MVTLKKPDEIDKMKLAGGVVANAHKLMREMVCPGIDTLSLDEAVEELIIRENALPSFKGYRVPGIKTPFPGAICVSINEEVVHGIPSRERVLKEGDIVSIDVGAFKDGYHGDAACTYPVGEHISAERERLMETTLEALHIGLSCVKPGNTIGDIGAAIEKWVRARGCGLVRDYAGHGIGRRMHEAPQVPNYGRAGNGMIMKAGMTFCVEPMVMSGAEPVRSTDNGWTVVTKDGSDSAHFEHTLLVTEDGVMILTPWE
ncbi:MAG: type I methionyl aminopeptidase [Synergistaceae bacterium]|jgi:methionyl aminopeptidase|nr:type I methionyl aminopeptidase [Synergistaceae bacterium]